MPAALLAARHAPLFGLLELPSRYKQLEPHPLTRVLCAEIHSRKLARLPFQQGLGCSLSLRIQYSSANMMAITRLVTTGSDGSGECKVSVGSK
jgi:hypothetical protein